MMLAMRVGSSNLDHSLNEGAGQVDVIGVDRAERNDFFRFGDGDSGGHRHRGREKASQPRPRRSEAFDQGSLRYELDLDLA